MLATTDSATSDLEYHKAIKNSGWKSRIIPTFRPDSVIDLNTENWKKNIKELSKVSGIDIHNYETFIKALRQRRQFFKSMGAVSTDMAILTPWTEELTKTEIGNIFQRALKEKLTDEDTSGFTAHMIMEMAGMSIEDGLVMQLHCGCYRNHNQEIYERLGGFDKDIFMYMEEVDLLYRAKKLGLNTFFYPKSQIIHLGSASSNGKTFPILQVYKGFLFFYKKHYSKFELFILRLILKLKAIIAYLIGKIKGNRYLIETYEEAFKLV